MAIIFFDDKFRNNLYPLSLTRPIADFRVGILTIAEKWSKYLNAGYSYLTEEYLSEKYPLKIEQDNLFINSSICPDIDLLEQVSGLNRGEALFAGELTIALRLSESDAVVFNHLDTDQYIRKDYAGFLTRISYPEDIFKNTDAEIKKDFILLTKGRSSASLSSTNTLIGDEIFIEEGVSAECSTFNSLQGPIYLGKDSQIWEGCHIRGSFSLGREAIVKMGAKIYGMTSIGPNCKAAGEINNSVIFGNSSKGHEGYLGNSVMGEWCNIGADSNNSNMKNNYAEVKLWDYTQQNFRKTGLQFCGLIMGDHSKCAINTMFNTGTVVGVSANIFGSGFPRNFIPDFSWGGSHGFELYSLKKMFETAERVYDRRKMVFSEEDKRMLTKVFELTSAFRNF